MSKNKPDFTRQITWVYTYDIDSTSDFYANQLGLEVYRDEDSARIFKTVNGACIGVCQVFGERVVEAKGSMISLVTDDVDACYAQLVDRGVPVDKPPHRLEQFGIYTFFITDPNGYIIEFQQFDD